MERGITMNNKEIDITNNVLQFNLIIDGSLMFDDSEDGSVAMKLTVDDSNRPNIVGTLTVAGPENILAAFKNALYGGGFKSEDTKIAIVSSFILRQAVRMCEEKLGHGKLEIQDEGETSVHGSN
jgi:hypothetical protein